MLPEPHSLSAGQEIALFRGTGAVSALFTAEYGAAREPPLYVHK